MDFKPFLDYLKDFRGYSNQTVRAYESDLAMFAGFVKGFSISRITQVDKKVLQQYIVHMRQKQNPRKKRAGLSDATIKRRLAALGSFVEYRRADGDNLPSNLFAGIGRKWKRNDEPKPVDPLVLDLLLASITNERDLVLFRLLIATGLRVSELHQLNRESIVFEEEIQPWGDTIILGKGSVLGKGRKKRDFYVDEETSLILAHYLDGRKDDMPALFLSERRQRLSVRAIQWTLDALCKRMGAPHITVHQLRHTFATTMANSDMSSSVLRELMGHQSFSTTLRYFKLNDQTVARGYHAATSYQRS